MCFRGRGRDRGWGGMMASREGKRAGGHEDTRGSAKVQIGAELLCKSAKVKRGGMGRGIVSGGRWRPQMAGVRKSPPSGLGSQLTGCQVRVLQVRLRVRVLNLYLMLNT